MTACNLLSGDSGLHSPAGFEVIGQQDATAYGLALGQDNAPGTAWENNEPAIQTLQAVLVRNGSRSRPDGPRRR